MEELSPRYVSVIEESCCAYGNCAIVAPNIFELPDDADIVRCRVALVSPLEIEAVRVAVRDCPTQALRLTAQPIDS